MTGTLEALCKTLSNARIGSRKGANAERRILSYFARHEPATDQERLLYSEMYVLAERQKEIRAKERKLKTDQKKARFVTYKMCYTVTDKGYIIDIQRQYIKAILRTAYYNALLFLQSAALRASGAEHENPAVDRRVYLIRGSKRTSKFLSMDEDKFIELSNKRLKGATVCRSRKKN